jgi:hypothetical protein
MKNTRILTRRAVLAGLFMAVSVTVVGATPSGATETYTFKPSTWTVDYQPAYNFQDLAAARIARVGITPIPIP